MRRGARKIQAIHLDIVYFFKKAAFLPLINAATLKQTAISAKTKALQFGKLSLSLGEDSKNTEVRGSDLGRPIPDLLFCLHCFRQVVV